jgi:hypothetical protein
MSDAFDYFRAYAVRALCKARSMPQGRMKHLKLVAGRIYNLLKKEAAYGPRTRSTWRTSVQRASWKRLWMNCPTAIGRSVAA